MPWACPLPPPVFFHPLRTLAPQPLPSASRNVSISVVFRPFLLGLFILLKLPERMPRENVCSLNRAMVSPLHCCGVLTCSKCPLVRMTNLSPLWLRKHRVVLAVKEQRSGRVGKGVHRHSSSDKGGNDTDVEQLKNPRRGFSSRHSCPYLSSLSHGKCLYGPLRKRCPYTARTRYAYRYVRALFAVLKRFRRLMH